MRRVVLIQPRRDGRIFGKAPGSPYTLMRLASLVPDEIPVEIWDENLRDLDLDTLREGDLVGVTSMTVTIERAEQIARKAMKQGAGVVMGGVHATLMPEHTATFAHSVMIGEGYFTWQKLIQDFAAEGVKGMQPRYEDLRWADLEGLATITDRVIAMVDENKNYWTQHAQSPRRTRGEMPGATGPPCRISGIPERQQAGQQTMGQQQVLVQVTRPEKNRGAERIEQREPHRFSIGAEQAPQQKKHRQNPRRRHGRHGKRLHNERRQTELDIHAALPGLLVELARHRPGRVVDGRRGGRGGPLPVDLRYDAIGQRPEKRVGYRAYQRSARVGVDVPSEARFFKQVRMQPGVLVHAKGKMIAQRHRRINFTDDVCGRVQGVDQPAGKKQPDGNTACRVLPRNYSAGGCQRGGRRFRTREDHPTNGSSARWASSLWRNSRANERICLPSVDTSTAP